jgi:acetoin utilization deacetylase AcuC-like enzyme
MGVHSFFAWSAAGFPACVAGCLRTWRAPAGEAVLSITRGSSFASPGTALHVLHTDTGDFMNDARLSRVGFCSDERFLDHLTPPGHPERPDRLRRLLEHLRDSGILQRLHQIPSRAAGIDDLEAVHTREHILRIRRICEAGGGTLDAGDTHASRASYDVALLAAGSVLSCIDAVLTGSVRAAFCAVRPPGHHAERGEPMGFCLFNNAAAGARYARRRHGIGRVAVLDWDVHHGNGTQHIFDEDPAVLYISLHQYPFYPGTGAASERGVGAGVGATLNIPLPAGSGEDRYREEFVTRVVPALREFAPGLLLISAGFDAHRDDPLADMRLTESSFGELTRLVARGTPVVSMLEGGYNLAALALSVEHHLQALIDSAA